MYYHVSKDNGTVSPFGSMWEFSFYPIFQY